MKPLLDTASLLTHRAPARPAIAEDIQLGATASPPPPLVGLRLAEYVLLAGIPIRYLVPDPSLLPDDSLRFFELDADWLGSLLDGILSIGLGSDAETGTAEARAAVAASLPLVRDLRRGKPVDGPSGTLPAAGSPGAGICGFLLRSTLVERWPDLIVRAYSGDVADGQNPDTTAGVSLLEPLRLERLTPSILVALWAQAPDLVILQEPASAPRLGIDLPSSGPRIRVRNADGTEKGVELPVSVSSTTGVVDLGALASSLQSAGHIGDATDGAAVAMQLLQPPVRRRFRRGAS